MGAGLAYIAGLIFDGFIGAPLGTTKTEFTVMLPGWPATNDLNVVSGTKADTDLAVGAGFCNPKIVVGGFKSL